jgi:UDP-glucose 4-epimerase
LSLHDVGTDVYLLDTPEAISARIGDNPSPYHLVPKLILDFDTLGEVVRDKEVVVHLAVVSDVVQAMNSPRDAFLVTCLGTQNLLEAVRKSTVDPQLILSSSFTVYKSPPDYLPIDERHPIGPGSPYAVTKAFQDQMTAAYGEIYGLREARLRFAAFFWPGQKDVNILRFILKALRNEDIVIEGGEQTRDWNFVSNVVQAILLAIWKKQLPFLTLGAEEKSL